MIMILNTEVVRFNHEWTHWGLLNMIASSVITILWDLLINSTLMHELLLSLDHLIIRSSVMMIIFYVVVHVKVSLHLSYLTSRLIEISFA